MMILTSGIGFTGEIFLYCILAALVLLVIGKEYVARKEEKDAWQTGFEPGKMKTESGAFWIQGIIAVVVVILLYFMLGDGPSGTTAQIFFAIFPYVAFGIFIVGSIYRYKKTGFKVSSLSSQFLEGKTLFFGVQPFHWGIMFLFFGHLIAFMVPSAVIAWNGDPVRLLILEVSSFVFGLSALFGLILLVYRRLTSRKLMLVSNRMDKMVYIVLLVQIISGLSVAYGERWGSSWFAGVLTPYLRSVFSLQPDIAAVSAMPWLVQLHIISAFFIIAIIPFTRFMHFLVAPVDYIWRKYQVVIWNYNRKDIRKSTKHTYGKEIRNH